MKTCIIYCPNHRPFTSPEKRWAKIASSLDSHNISYDMVQSEKAQSVERLVAMMINNGYDNIIIAGGDSALNDTLNCLMKTEKKIREAISIGIIPNGTMNDFAAYWGFGYDDIDKAVASIEAHRVRKVDAGIIKYTDKRGNDYVRYFLNSVNVGLLAKIQKLRQQTRHTLVSRKASFAATLVMIGFMKMVYKMKYTLNDITETHRITTMCIGSARGYGQTPNAVPYNGMLDITAVRHSLWTQFFGAVYIFLRGKILNHKLVMPYRTNSIQIETQDKLPISIDGRTAPTPYSTITINILPEEINFIIEK